VVLRSMSSYGPRSPDVRCGDEASNLWGEGRRRARARRRRTGDWDVRPGRAGRPGGQPAAGRVVRRWQGAGRKLQLRRPSHPRAPPRRIHAPKRRRDGHQVANRLRGTCPLCRECTGQSRTVWSWPTYRSAPSTVDGAWLARCLHHRSFSTDVPDNVSESHAAARLFPGPRHTPWPDVPDNRPLSLPGMRTQPRSDAGRLAGREETG
jgi:hypothetical protein